MSYCTRVVLLCSTKPLEERTEQAHTSIPLMILKTKNNFGKPCKDSFSIKQGWLCSVQRTQISFASIVITPSHRVTTCDIITFNKRKNKMLITIKWSPIKSNKVLKKVIMNKSRLHALQKLLYPQQQVACRFPLHCCSTFLSRAEYHYGLWLDF